MVQLVLDHGEPLASVGARGFRKTKRWSWGTFSHLDRHLNGPETMEAGLVYVIREHYRPIDTRSATGPLHLALRSAVYMILRGTAEEGEETLHSGYYIEG